MTDKTESTVRLYSYQDDLPRDGRGTLIPKPVKRRKPVVAAEPQFTPRKAIRAHRQRRAIKATVGVVVAAALFLLVGFSYDQVSRLEQVAAPTLSLIDPYTANVTPLSYGEQPALANTDFYLGVLDSFIEEQLTFVEVDLTKRQLHYFKHGVLLQSAEVLAEGEKGTWWETPAGLYLIEEKEEKVFSNIGQVYFPWQLRFEGNYVIHGWPTYPDGADVMAEFLGGGIRIDNAKAAELFEQVKIGTPVLVHQTIEKKTDDFVYEPRVPKMGAAHYFVADIKNDTVLAASDLDATAPIASLTKLMTALVAAEKLDLDGRVTITSPTFVTSLIPRLAERPDVSVYSLLQLLLVESSNEAAETIAGEVGRERFIAAMNDKARELGLSNTTFADPSGISAQNVSTVSDLYKLVTHIYQNRPFIFDITARQEVTSAYIGGEFGTLLNFNEVQGATNFIGGKVGETMAAGQTSISLHRISVSNEDREVAVILLGSTQRSADVEQLLDYVEERFSN